MEKELKIAGPKGYLFGECVDLLKRAGYDTAPLENRDRKLVVYSQIDSIKYIISRPMDVPVYVEHGACDIGFAGKDVLAEKMSKVYELLDLKTVDAGWSWQQKRTRYRKLKSIISILDQ